MNGDKTEVQAYSFFQYAQMILQFPKSEPLHFMLELVFQVNSEFYTDLL